MNNFLIVPHFEVFETAHISRESNIDDNSCVKLFKLAWYHSIDYREKVVWITQELNTHLIEKRYKSEKRKRLALFSVVSVYEETLGDEEDFSLARLASRLSISGNKQIYYVIDNPEKKSILEKIGFGNMIKIISSKEACELFESKKE